MKLKLFIFPVFLVISLYIIIFHISPEMDSLEIVRQEHLKQEEELAKVQEKVKNAQSLLVDINNHLDEESFINNYYPGLKEDEKVIMGINFIANKSQVALIDLTINESNYVMPAIDPNVDNVISYQTDPNLINTSISVLGEYSQTKAFLESLYKLDRINDFNVVEISSKNLKKKSEGEEEIGESKILATNVAMSFFHLPKISQGVVFDSPLLSNKNKIDWESVVDLRNLITEPIPEIEVGDFGTSNIFFPN